MKAQKNNTDNFSEFLTSYDPNNVVPPDNQPVKPVEAGVNPEANNDNFSAFLDAYDGPLQKVNVNLGNISNAITRIEESSAGAKGKLQIVIDTINKIETPPIAKAMESVKQLNEITSDLKSNILQANMDNYKEILKEYIEIAEQTSSNEIAAETLNLSEKIISTPPADVKGDTATQG